mgnify:FL=1|tara:strand:+ start:621 stop:2384 length:1764 start_codon:yes stop_codon:yes gene_type:complete
MRLLFDIETDGLLRQMSVIHCLVVMDIDTEEVYRYDDSGQYPSITEGLTFLMEAKELWGHNLWGFDIPAIQSITPFFHPRCKVYDTLILSRLFFNDMLDRDLRARPANMPGNLYGRHSLESWGYRLGVFKSEFGKQLDGDWSTYTPEMLEYCVADVKANLPLVKLFEPRIEKYQQSIDLEHACAKIMTWQEMEGFPFHIKKAQQLESKLRVELETLSDEMRSTFAFVKGNEFTPARDNKTRGYVAGAAMTRIKDFSPTSRDHIAFAFKEFRGWEPSEFTDSGRPKIDEKVLKEIGTDEALKFARLLELQKALGQLSEGRNAWLKLVESDGRIHHSCFLNTVTGRNCHVRPNLAQVNSEHEYRELFHPGDGRIQLGSDASGLELRCLSHYIAAFGNTEFGKEVVEGDIHQKMANIAGVDRRTQKTITYAMLYGSGSTKLGLCAGASKKDAAKRGAELKEKLLTGIDGFKELVDAVQTKAESGYLRGIDGRPLKVRKAHAALNTLLQGCGSSITKAWVVRANELLKEAQIDYWPMAFVHDEMQLSVHPDHVEKASDLIKKAMKDVEHTFLFRVPLDCDVQTGTNWADTH